MVKFIFIGILLLSNVSAQVTTSLTDEIKNYKFDVYKASSTEFENFRRLPDIIEAYDRVYPKHATKMFRWVKKKSPWLFKYSSLLEKNDKLGNPLLVDNYEDFGVFSPTTMRYIFIYAELSKLFNLDDGCNIIELGCGYGGQCSVIAAGTTFADYTLIDLKYVLPLIERYLSALNIDNFTTAPPEVIVSEDYDLFISNYGISEVWKEYQDSYIENVISRCKRGYIIYNHTSDGKAYTAKEFCEKLREYGIEPIITWEPLKTFENNVLIVWGLDKEF